MSRRSPVLPDDEIAAILRRIDDGAADRRERKSATLHFLALLGQAAPGHSVEVRVPPFGAIQCVPGVEHRRGTPPAVVEMTAPTWLDLARGRIDWAEADVDASGERSDLSPWLPLV